jgi:hypothetical protein
MKVMKNAFRPVSAVRARGVVAGRVKCWWLVFRWKDRRPNVRDSRNRAPVPRNAVLSGALPRLRWVRHGMSDNKSDACAEVGRARGKWKYFCGGYGTLQPGGVCLLEKIPMQCHFPTSDVSSANADKASKPSNITRGGLECRE